MAKLVARMVFSNSICHYFENKWIYVNKENISSICPDGKGFHVLTMKSGESYTIDMSFDRIMKELEE